MVSTDQTFYTGFAFVNELYGAIMHVGIVMPDILWPPM